MKKILFFASALAGLFFAASCQQENLEPVAGGNTVTYTVQIPDAIGTKAVGDEVTNANVLHYEVYRTKNAETKIFSETEDNLLYHKAVKANADGTFTIELELINNQNFTVLLWAQHQESLKDGENHLILKNEAYNVENLTNVTINTTTPLKANQLDYAAFAGHHFIKANVKDTKKVITLHRPVAQLNIGTSAASLTAFNDKVDLISSSVSVKGLSNTYNVATEAAGAVYNEAISYNDQPVLKKANDEYETFTVGTTPYPYVGMNYVGFAAEEGSTIKVSYLIKTSEGDITNTIENVPVKANYRTNIVGNLITSKSDYVVKLDAEWGAPEELVEIWDGKTLTAPDYNTETKTWTIDNGAELAWIANAINGTLPEEEPVTRTDAATPAYDKTQVIVLSKDINLGDCEWTPIGTNAKHFMGLFDGNGHVISDFKITKKHNGGSQAAFFGTVSGSPIFRNVTIQNAKVVYPGEGDFYGAALIGTAYGNLTIQNVIVKNCEISGNNKVAGLLAHDGVVSSLNIDNCHVLNCEIVSAHETDGGNVGGLVGLFQGAAKTAANAAPYGDHIIKNSSVKNTVINAVNSTNSGKRSNGQFVACVTGKATLVINDCEVEGNTFTQNEGVTYVSPYGVFVGGDRLDDRQVTVIVDGKMMIDNGFTNEGNTFEVSNAAHLLKAAKMVADGDVIKLLADVTFNEIDRTDNGGWWDGLGYSGDKSFTIDLGGHTISQNGALNDYLVWIKNDGEKANIITFKNGTMDAGTTAYCAIATASSNKQTITINLENINLINNISNGAVAKIRGGSVLNVKAGTVITGKNSYTGIEAVGNTTEVNIYEGAKIYQNGTSSSWGWLVGASYNATVNVYGGEGKSARGAFGAMTSGGTINVSGGEWIANNDGTVANDNKGVLIAQSDKQYNSGAGNAVVNVTGGTFKGGYNCYGNAPGDAQINIKGGNFNADPESYVVDGYMIDEVNGIYTVLVDPAAKIGETEYATLQEALNVGGNVTLLRDVNVAESLILLEGKTAVLDLNGKSIKGANESEVKHIYALKNYGTLTIVDNTDNKEGSIDSRGIYNYNKLTLESGKISAIDGNGGYAVNNQSGSTFVMNGGCIAADYEDNDAPGDGYDATALNVPSGAEATLNAGKITNAGNFTYAVAAAGTLNIPETSTIEIIGRHGAVSVSGGTTTINAGTYGIVENTQYTDNVLYVYSTGTMIINGGTFIGDKDVANGGTCVYDSNGGVTINGGVFGNSSGGDVWGTTGTVIKGGKFEHLTETSHIADGYELNANGEVVAK